MTLKPWSEQQAPPPAVAVGGGARLAGTHENHDQQAQQKSTQRVFASMAFVKRRLLGEMTPNTQRSASQR